MSKYIWILIASVLAGMLMFFIAVKLTGNLANQNSTGFSYESVNNGTKWCINGWAYNMKENGQLEPATYVSEQDKDSVNPVPLLHARCGTE